MKTLHNEPLAPYTSLNVGGPAEELIIVDTYDELLDTLRLSDHPHIIGFGCNLLISDAGISGRTILWRGGALSFNDTELIVDAGVWWDDAVQATVKLGLYGLELTSEIPSSVGGALFGNIAAYGQQVSDTLSWIEVYNLDTHAVEHHQATDFEFRYRWSSLQDARNLIILRAGFVLAREPLHELRYDSALVVAKQLGITADTIEARRQIIVETRKRAGSIYHPNEADRQHTAGSFFKNPLVSLEQAKQLASYDESGKTLERIEKQNQIHGGSAQRASAAHVLLAAGFSRGQTWNKVRLHPDHVLKIETLDGATATEVKTVADEIINAVKNQLDITIEPEVKFIGF